MSAPAGGGGTAAPAARRSSVDRSRRLGATGAARAPGATTVPGAARVLGAPTATGAARPGAAPEQGAAHQGGGLPGRSRSASRPAVTHSTSSTEAASGGSWSLGIVGASSMTSASTSARRWMSGRHPVTEPAPHARLLRALPSTPDQLAVAGPGSRVVGPNAAVPATPHASVPRANDPRADVPRAYASRSDAREVVGQRSPARAVRVARLETSHRRSSLIGLHRSATAPVELAGVPGAAGQTVQPPRSAPVAPPRPPGSDMPGTPPVPRSASGDTSSAGRTRGDGRSSLVGGAAGAVPSTLAALLAAEAAGAFAGPGAPVSARSDAGPPIHPTLEGDAMSPSAPSMPVSRSWSGPDDRELQPLSPEAMNDLVDRVVERLEDRVVEELERRGRRRMPGVF